MRSIIELLHEWKETMGWTLLNSLWQAFAILVLVAIVLRIVSSKLSQIRYIIACSGMAIMLLLNSGTFFYLMQPKIDPISAAASHQYAGSHEIFAAEIRNFSLPEFICYIKTVIDANMPLILSGWLIGAALFSLRMVGGWWYISKLRTQATILNNEWSDLLQHLAQQLEIGKVVSLAQSARIHSPLIVGFLKPMVLIPVGMFSGLSSEQIETIFIHELAHIRRHDYIVNLIQSIFETVFFFNPFVWILSNIIRREREYCCDDAVVMKHGSSIAYAHALTHLEEVRLSKSVLALSLAENKNQLLNRIKRIMEKSAKNHSGRDRMIPLVFLVIGLACASWLTIGPDNSFLQNNIPGTQKLSADTAIKKKSKSAAYYRQSVTTIDERGEPHEEVIENYTGDLDLIPPVPPVEPVWSIPGVPEIPIIPEIPIDEMFLPFSFTMDSIPEQRFRYKNDKEWAEFSKAFEEKFRTQFSDFYKSHQKDLEKIMDEMKEKFSDQLNEENWAAINQEWALDQQEKALAELQRSGYEAFHDIDEHAQRAQEEARMHMQEWQREHQQSLEQMAQEMHGFQMPSLLPAMNEAQFQLMEENLRRMEKQMKSFEKELKENLVKDGYISKEHNLENINWTDDGEIKINGIKIKEADRKKYNDLHRKYLRNTTNFNHVE